MGHKKTNEAWFGDSFNRGPMTMSFATSDGNSYTCAVNNITLEPDSCGAYSVTADLASGVDQACYTLAKGVTSHAEGYNVSAYKPITTALDEKIETLQARIDRLESMMNKKDTKLRLGLKTLNYVREI